MTERITVTIFLFLSLDVISSIIKPINRVKVIESIGTSTKRNMIEMSEKPTPLVIAHARSSGRKISNAKK